MLSFNNFPFKHFIPHITIYTIISQCKFHTCTTINNTFRNYFKFRQIVYSKWYETTYRHITFIVFNCINKFFNKLCFISIITINKCNIFSIGMFNCIISSKIHSTIFLMNCNYPIIYICIFINNFSTIIWRTIINHY